MKPAHRYRLPDTRPSLTVKRTVMNHEIYVTVGFYDTEGNRSRPGEVFVRVAKHGSFLAGALDGWCILLSIALQSGVAWKHVRDKFQGTQFGTDRDVHHSSLLDGLVQMVQTAIDERRRIIGED